MKEIQELHQKAMTLAESAQIEKLKGNSEESYKQFSSAFEFEKQAALLLLNQYEVEPTRSILFRSAASLSIQCGKLEESERLIASALSGLPPAEIASELRDLLEEVYFNRHLETRGVKLQDDELQLSLAGNAVSFGIIQSDYFLNRVNSTSKIIYRTVERFYGREYRDDGKVDKSIKNKYETFLSVPRAASFAVTIKIGQPTNQIELMDDKPKIIEEILTCFDLYEKNQLEQLSAHIKDEAYFTNFVSLSKQLSPDGENINFVGFTSNIANKQKSVQLTRTKALIKEELKNSITKKDSSEKVSLVGKLLFADNTKNKREIRITDDNQKVHKVRVPLGMMDDIVKPLWDERVLIQGKLTSKNIIDLEEIDKVDE